MVMSNSIIATIVERMPRLELPDCYLAAGALYQTVWHRLCGRDPNAGVEDYDINYFDATDLSWGAEAAAIRRGAELLGDLHVTLDIRNEARVHLWYEEKFGVPCPPYPSTEAAIATFPSTSAAFGIRMRDCSTSTRPTGSPICSRCALAPTRSSRRARSTRPRQRAGGASGPTSS
jgi:hypothetical protein